MELADDRLLTILELITLTVELFSKCSADASFTELLLSIIVLTIVA